MSFYVFTLYALTLYVSDGPDNLCEPTSADSRNPESALWSSRQCLPVLGSLLCCIPQSCLTAGSAEHSPLHQWKASHDGYLHFKENTFSKSANTFDNNHMWCLFFVRWYLTTLEWTGVILCTLTMDITRLLFLIVLFLLFAPCICNCVTGFVPSRMKAFKLQMVAQTPASTAASPDYYLGPLDQTSSLWGLGEYVASAI